MLKKNTVFILLTGLILTGCEDDEPTTPEPTIPPSASFMVETTEGSAPLTVTFTNTSDLGNGSNVEYSWNFGNGDTSAEESPVHTFNEAGEFPVTLTITTAHGSDISDPIMIMVVPPPTLLLSSSSSSITVGGSTTLSVELANLETYVFGVSMQISYDASAVEVDTLSGFVQGTYFGTNAISLFETVDNTVHFSISAIQGDAMVNGTDKLCDFTVTGLSSGTSTYTIVPEERPVTVKSHNLSVPFTMASP
jgi:PKD repeat protein